MKSLFAFLIAMGMSAPSAVYAAPVSHLPGVVSASAASCSADETFVKGYKKADGTAVSGYCRHSAGSAKECRKDEIYVHGHVKANGTKVRGYCRKQAPATM